MLIVNVQQTQRLRTLFKEHELILSQEKYDPDVMVAILKANDLCSNPDPGVSRDHSRHNRPHLQSSTLDTNSASMDHLTYFSWVKGCNNRAPVCLRDFNAMTEVTSHLLITFITSIYPDRIRDAS